jgi:hypothetical protein
MSTTPIERTLEALERRLLEAARVERPRATARQRVVVALAGGAALGSATVGSVAAAATVGSAGGATGTGTIAAASSAAVVAPSTVVGASGAAAVGSAKVLAGATFVGLAKAVAVGAISGAVVLGAAEKLQAPRSSGQVPPSAPAALVETTSRKPLERTRSASRAAEQAEAVDVEPSHVVPPSTEAPSVFLPTKPALPERSANKIPSHVAAQPPPQPFEVPPRSIAAGGVASSLTEEVGLLDRARDALVRGDPAHAIFILDSYERTNVGTRLAAEAALLRIEALVQRGALAKAAPLAREFLRAHPETPVADRMRSIIQAAER